MEEVTYYNSGKKKIWSAKVATPEHFEKMVDKGVYEIFFRSLKAGDLSKYDAIHELSDNNKNFLNENGNVKTNDRLCLWQFGNEVSIGDTLIIVNGLKRIWAKAEVIGNYFYDEKTDTHKIPVKYDLDFKGEIFESFAQKTLTDITNYHEFIDMIYRTVSESNKRNTAEEINLTSRELQKTDKMSADKQKLRDSLKKMQEVVQFYLEAQPQPLNMITEINSLDRGVIQNVLNDYYSDVATDQIVNNYRREVLENLLTGKELTVRDVSEFIEYRKSIKRFMWSEFAIVSGLYYKLFNIDKVEEELRKNLEALFLETGLDTELNCRKEFNMMGSRQFGASGYTYAFSKKKYKNGITSQVGIDIVPDVIVQFWNSNIDKVYNTTKIDVNSDTLKEDIIEALLVASQNYDQHAEISNEETYIKEHEYEGPVILEKEFTNDYKQLIIDGAPGTGKSYGVEQKVKEFAINHERVTFYQDYEYHNFVGSILPKLNGTDVVYEFCKGPFTKLLTDAFNNPNEKHYLIIEELTRGNAAAIFGDIFQLLDRDEEGWSMYPITNDNIFAALDDSVQDYLNSTECYKGKIVLPPNFSILCTINSSDQNVYPLDTAFKRRFDYEIKSTKPHDEFTDFEIQFGTMEAISWESFYQELNKFILINMGLKEDKQVGPYFIKSNDKATSIQTKLAMYMWNDLQKVHTMSGIKIFDESRVQTLYKVDELFRTGSKEKILGILTTDFKNHFKLED